MNDRDFLVLVGLGALAYYIYENQNTANSFVCCLSFEACQLEADVTTAVSGWQNAGDGPTWVPVLNAAESQYGLPANMLAALAYQESSFIPAVINGTHASFAGALGMMQLMPQYYASVQVPTPFTNEDIENQISDAANTLVSNYGTLGSWPLALAAYNAGVGAVQAAGGIPNNGQTPAYVAGILANAPAANV